MRVIGIKINNYKSFGDNNNILRFDSENTVALIGKNESGKSNTLMAIKDLSFFEPNLRTNMFADKNRITNGEITISIDIEFDEQDFPDQKEVIKNYKSRFIFRKKDESIWINFDGCISDILSNDKKLLELSNEISKFSSVYQQEKNASILKEKIKNFTNTYIKLISADNILSMNAEKKEYYEKFRELLENYYESFKKVLPKIIYFSNNMVLKNQYTYDDITKNEDIMGLTFLLEALKFSLEDLKSWLNSNDTAVKQKYSIKFQNELTRFNKNFQKYYKTNKIELLFNVDSKKIEFSVKDDLKRNINIL